MEATTNLIIRVTSFSNFEAQVFTFGYGDQMLQS